MSENETVKHTYTILKLKLKLFLIFTIFTRKRNLLRLIEKLKQNVSFGLILLC